MALAAGTNPVFMNHSLCLLLEILVVERVLWVSLGHLIGLLGDLGESLI